MVSSPVRQLAAIVFPWRIGAEKAVPLMRWGLHLLLWTGVLVGLWYLNRGLEGFLRSPWPTLHRTWLPLLGALVYALAWLSRGLWKSLQNDPAPSAWPEIDTAWDEACTALKGASIDLRETPTFLILGPLTPDLQSLLTRLGTTAMSPRANTPFHVFAQREGTFVVCDHLAQLAHADRQSAPDPSSAGLHHLCQLVARARGGKAAIQGIVLVVPFADMQSGADTMSAVDAMRDDLRTVRDATRMDVPVYVTVTGLPASEGRFQRFPLLPDLDPAEVESMYQDGVDNLCEQQIARGMIAHLRLDTGPTDDGTNPILRENVRLFQLLCAVRTARTRLGELIIEGTRNDCSEPGMLAGCYFLPASEATSADALWEDLRAHQQAATWTADAIAAHARQRRGAWLGLCLGVLGVCVGLAGVGGYLALRL